MADPAPTTSRTRWYKQRFDSAYKIWTEKKFSDSSPIFRELLEDPATPNFHRAWSHLLLASTESENHEQRLYHATMAERQHRSMMEAHPNNQVHRHHYETAKKCFNATYLDALELAGKLPANLDEQAYINGPVPEHLLGKSPEVPKTQSQIAGESSKEETKETIGLPEQSRAGQSSTDTLVSTSLPGSTKNRLQPIDAESLSEFVSDAATLGVTGSVPSHDPASLSGHVVDETLDATGPTHRKQHHDVQKLPGEQTVSYHDLVSQLKPAQILRILAFIQARYPQKIKDLIVSLMQDDPELVSEVRKLVEERR